MVTTQQIDKCIAVAKRYGATKLVLFGSAVHDAANARVIDLLCEGVEGRDFFKMGAEMEDETMKPVDVVSMVPCTRFVQYNMTKGRVLHATY